MVQQGKKKHNERLNTQCSVLKSDLFNCLSNFIANAAKKRDVDLFNLRSPCREKYDIRLQQEIVSLVKTSPQLYVISTT